MALGMLKADMEEPTKEVSSFIMNSRSQVARTTNPPDSFVPRNKMTKGYFFAIVNYFLQGSKCGTIKC